MTVVLYETQRLVLRNVKPQDAAVMYDYRNNEICARYQRGQTKDLPGIQMLVEKRRTDILSAQSNCLIAVALKESDEMIGEIVVLPSDGAISLGYTFHYAHHRKGYAFEALSVLIEDLHRRFHQWEFISFTEPENEASMALLRKLGYEDLGYVSQLASQAFGKWVTDGI